MPGVADLVIILVVLAGVTYGVARGLYGPLATEGSFIAAVLVVTRLHTGVDGFLPVGFRVAVSLVLVMILAGLLRLALSPVVALLRRAPGLGKADAPVGGVAHGLLALVLLYLVLGLVLDFDRNVYPLLQAGVVSAHDLQKYQQAVDQRPWLKGFVDQQAIKQQEAQAARTPVTVDAVSRVEGFLNFYLEDVRKPLLVSRLAPIINNVGGQVPYVGHHRPYLAGASTT